MRRICIKYVVKIVQRFETRAAKRVDENYYKIVARESGYVQRRIRETVHNFDDN